MGNTAACCEKDDFIIEYSPKRGNKKIVHPLAREIQGGLKAGATKSILREGINKGKKQGAISDLSDFVDSSDQSSTASKHEWKPKHFSH